MHKQPLIHLIYNKVPVNSSSGKHRSNRTSNQGTGILIPALYTISSTHRHTQHQLRTSTIIHNKQAQLEAIAQPNYQNQGDRSRKTEPESHQRRYTGAGTVPEIRPTNGTAMS